MAESEMYAVNGDLSIPKPRGVSEVYIVNGDTSVDKPKGVSPVYAVNGDTSIPKPRGVSPIYLGNIESEVACPVGVSVVKVGNFSVTPPEPPLPVIPPYTLRVEFVDVPEKHSSSFDPTQGTGNQEYPEWKYGTWSHVAGSVYDWTYQYDTWLANYTTSSGNFYDSPWQLIQGESGTSNLGIRELAYKVLGANLSGVKYIPKLFYGCTKYLVSINLFDTSHIKSAANMLATHRYSMPLYLKTIPNFDFSSVTDDDNPFGWTRTVARNKGVAGLYSFASDTTSRPYLTSIPDLVLPTDTNTSVDYMFNGQRNVETGALALYNKFAAANWQGVHQKCFTNCGAGTVTGAADLAQIPTSWGGTMA